MFQQKDHMKLFRKRAMALDFSWDKSAETYIDIYKSLKNQTG
jgi:starch synthase